MRKKYAILTALIIGGGTGWFFLLRPEQISEDRLTKDFSAHQQAYTTIADYLTENKISTEITGLMSIDHHYGVTFENAEQSGKFCAAVEDIMAEDHDVIISDGTTVEFVYHSTGGLFRRLYGSVIYNGESNVLGKMTEPLPQDGWHLYVTDK